MLILPLLRCKNSVRRLVVSAIKSSIKWIFDMMFCGSISLESRKLVSHLNRGRSPAVCSCTTRWNAWSSSGIFSKHLFLPTPLTRIAFSLNFSGTVFSISFFSSVIVFRWHPNSSDMYFMPPCPNFFVSIALHTCVALSRAVNRKISTSLSQFLCCSNPNLFPFSLYLRLS